MKNRILFVDDDANILNALRRSLRGLRDDWEMVFAEGGLQALEQMAQAPFDVVVSDMRMPQLDGAQLLSEVQRRYPGTIRVILSGYAEEESILRTVAPAHQYIAKPSDPAALIGMMNRAITLRRLLRQDNLRRLATGLKTLPTPPALYLQVTEELASPLASAASVAQIIERDVAMTAEILKLTNSAYFALAAHVSTPLQAVRLLGFETTKSLVLACGIFRQFQGGGAAAPMIDKLNRHSLRLGALAKAVAKAENLNRAAADHALCAGMLAHIGSLVLLDNQVTPYRAALARVGAGRDLPSAEREIFGATHGELGAYLLGLWGFGDPVVEAVCYALQPSSCIGDSVSALTCLHVAQTMGPGFPLLTERQPYPAALDQDYIKRIGTVTHIPLWEKTIKTATAETLHD